MHSSFRKTVFGCTTATLLLTASFAVLADASLENNPNIENPYSQLNLPSTTISDFPGENIPIQTQYLNYDYTDVFIPGPNGLDLEVKRRYRTRPASLTTALAGFGKGWELDVPKIIVSQSYTDEPPVAGYLCLNPPTNFNLKVILNSESLNTVGFPSSGDLPLGTLLAFEDNSVFRCDSTTPVLLTGDGRRIEFVRASDGVYLASRIVDGFGNTIQYNYTDNSTSGVRLSSLVRSDGARIDFDYTGGPLSKITYGTRVVNYGYTSVAGRGLELATHTDPEGRTTTYSYVLYGLQSVELPSGAKATYHYTTLNPDMGGHGQIDQKEITTPEGQSRYFLYRTQNSTYALRAVDVYVSEENAYGTQHKNTIFTFYSGKNSGWYSANEPSLDTVMNGVILKIDVRKGGTYLQQPDGELVYRKINVWTQVRNGSIGCGKRMGINEYTYYYRCARPQLSSSTTSTINDTDFDVFSSTYMSRDKYGFVTKSKVTAADGSVKYNKQTYSHDLALWLIGRPAITSMSTNGTTWQEKSKVTYWSSIGSYRGKPRYQYQYGRWVKQFASYHPSGDVMKITYNGSSNYELNENYYRGRPQKITVPARYDAGTVSAYATFDYYGNPISKTDFNGIVTSFEYDGVDRLTKTNYSGSHWFDEVIEYHDDQKYLVRKIGNAYSWRYFDSLGRLTRTLQEDITNPGTRSYKAYSYNKQNQATFSSFPSTASSPSIGRVFEYDGLGRRISETIATTSTVRSWSYPAGHSVRYVDGRGYPTLTKFRSYGSLNYNSPIQIDQSAESSGGGGSPPPIDPPPGGGGCIGVRCINPNSVTPIDGGLALQASPSTSDSLSLQSSGMMTIQAAAASSTGQIVTTIAYNLFDNITSISQGGVTETRIYDAYQQLCKQVRPETGITAFDYNTQGQVLWQALGTTGSTTACGGETAAHKVTFAYDNRGDLRSKYAADGTLLAEYTLDANGNLQTLRSDSTTSTYNYNDRNLVTDQTTTIGGVASTLYWTYDSYAHVQTLKYPNNQAVGFTPNALGQPTTAGSYVSGVTYYPGGQVQSFSRLNGVNRTVVVDAAGRTTSIADKKGTANRFKQDYTYDSEHNLENIYDRVQSAYNITGLAYDGAGRLESGTGNWGTTQLTYDDTGNITSMNLGTKSLSYAYDGANRLTGISGSLTKTFGYDGRGNVTSNGLRGFTYNNDNQLVASGTITLAYDGNGLRTQKKIGSSTDLFVYSLGGQLLYKRAANGQGTNYVYLGSELVAKVSSSLIYTSTDLLGSVVLETTSAGGVSKRYHYEPFGRALETGQQDDPGYTGHLFDDDLGLNYMKARYYDPLIGRFYSNDPVGFRGAHSFNRYAYANNNPYKFVDPTGMDSESQRAHLKALGSSWTVIYSDGSGPNPTRIGIFKKAREELRKEGKLDGQKLEYADLFVAGETNEEGRVAGKPHSFDTREARDKYIRENPGLREIHGLTVVGSEYTIIFADAVLPPRTPLNFPEGGQKLVSKWSGLRYARYAIMHEVAHGNGVEDELEANRRGYYDSKYPE